MAALKFKTRSEPVETATSEELMAWVACGNIDAFNILVVRHGSLVLGVAYCVIGSATGNRVAEDLAQEAWTNAWHASSSFKKEGSFCGWIKRITINTCISYTRKLRIRPWDMQVGENPDFPITDHQDTSARSPDAVVARSELLDNLAECQSRLNGKPRIVIDLFKHGATQRQIAAALGISLGGANKLLKSVFCSLRECMEIKGHSPEELALF